jgi:asparagine synthetase B (glutamine-hydrolysing)
VREWRHWDIDPNPRIRYKREEEYAEHFLHLLRESVKARLRSPTRVGISLSGGYDSSSIAALAALELAPERLLSFSWIFDELTECDERPAIHAMVEHFNLEPTYIPADGLWPLRDWETWPHNPNMPEGNAFRLMKLRLEEAAAASSARVLLHGSFGNEMFMPGAYWLADWLSEGRILMACTRLVAHLYRRGWSWYARVGLFRVAAWLLDTIPGGRTIRPRKALKPPTWLLPSAWERLQKNMNNDDWLSSAVRSRKQDAHRNLLDSIDAHGYGLRPQLFDHQQLEVRSPYYNQNLIAFILAIPGYVIYDGIQYKHLLYRAMKEIWPETVRQQPSTGLLVTLYKRGYERETTIRLWLLSDPKARWCQYVQPEFVLGGLDTTYGIKSVIPWRCLALEIWQRHRQRGTVRKPLVTV